MEDQPRSVRKGEELDLNALQQYFESVKPEWSGEWDYKQFPSGYSNLTYWLKVGDLEMVLRRPPFGAQAKGGHDMFREYRVLRDLYPSFSKIPKVYHYCENESVIGAPFYLMERVQGTILRQPGGKGFVPLAPNVYQQISESWLNALVELHQIDYKSTPLADFGRPEGYTERQVVGWSKRYFKAKTAEVKATETLIEWLNNSIPATQNPALVHNDYKYDNIVFEGENWGEVRAILDWEMSTIGDPLMDLGTSLAYWINETDPDFERPTAMLPTFFSGNPSRSDIVQAYATKTGHSIDDFVYYYAFGLFKVAVIVQQIFYRYKKGFTQDPRFAEIDKLGNFCCQKALQSIQKGQLDNLF